MFLEKKNECVKLNSPPTVLLCYSKCEKCKRPVIYLSVAGYCRNMADWVDSVEEDPLSLC